MSLRDREQKYGLRIDRVSLPKFVERGRIQALLVVGEPFVEVLLSLRIHVFSRRSARRAAEQHDPNGSLMAAAGARHCDAMFVVSAPVLQALVPALKALTTSRGSVASPRSWQVESSRREAPRDASRVVSSMVKERSLLTMATARQRSPVAMAMAQQRSAMGSLPVGFARSTPEQLVGARFRCSVSRAIDPIRLRVHAKAPQQSRPLLHWPAPRLQGQGAALVS
jgi:hypothetical protein